MKKLMIILLALSFCASNSQCRTKKMNRASEFLKGTVALASAAGLAYLAYEAPVGKIQEKCTNLLEKITKPNAMKSFNRWLENRAEISLNHFGTSIPWEKVNKSRIFSFLTIIPAWELAKYGIIKLGNSFKSHKKVSSCKIEG